MKMFIERKLCETIMSIDVVCVCECKCTAL